VTQDARKRWDAARGRLRIRAIRGGKWWRERSQKSLSMIPHLFTLINLAMGVLSIIQTMYGNYLIAAVLVGVSLFADGLDGRLARWFKADGEFGKELDSLADIVSFGTAPVILLYQMLLAPLGIYGLVVILIFPMCGALRLARFNIVKTHGFFMGVPITAAGTLLATFAFYIIQETTREPRAFTVAAVILGLGFLMISTIPYPDLKKLGRKSDTPMVVAIAGPVGICLWILLATNWNPWALLLLPLTAYTVSGPWLLLVREWQGRVTPLLRGAGRE